MLREYHFIFSFKNKELNIKKQSSNFNHYLYEEMKASQ